ncbi:MAG: UDP-N-acetylglucosamine 2-epimerase (non-hydrolyzing) [Myxococcales bacterium]|nr:UDP-N-acetylglucosamine 2-epimerase (non-hydrolyzing) [Myxococcales bacterium]
MGAVINVVGARPNFMKIAPLVRALSGVGVDQLLVHTGQHYDEAMSRIFFEDLQMPTPDVYLGVGSGSHAEQTARVMIDFEKVCLEHKPAMVIVVGDVNSTIACALVAAKLGIRVAHVEAGLRSFDRRMPEEINRVLTDRISDFLFTPSEDADLNLLKEGFAPEHIFRVGNIMIDSLYSHVGRARATKIAERLGLPSDGRKYGVVTLHRPSNVDDPEVLRGIVSALNTVSQKIPLVFPVHPRTRGSLARFPLTPYEGVGRGIAVIEPLGYLEFLGLVSGSAIVLTDSGGLQEETTALGIPCLTLRENTERPITVEEGTNQVVGTNPEDIVAAANSVLAGNNKFGRIPALWDGKTALRIADIVAAAVLR